MNRLASRVEAKVRVPTDSLTLVVASLVLVATAFAASLAPALRATRVNYVEALKGER